MQEHPTNSDDVIDSRDVIATIKELEAELEQERELLTDHPDTPAATARDYRLNTIKELEEELEPFKALAKKAAPSCDWDGGATLIRDSYFTDYCEEMVEDMGGLPHNFPSYLVINWEATADNLRTDYASVDFDGVAYLVRY